MYVCISMIQPLLSRLPTLNNTIVGWLIIDRHPISNATPHHPQTNAKPNTPAPSNSPPKASSPQLCDLLHDVMQYGITSHPIQATCHGSILLLLPGRKQRLSRSLLLLQFINSASAPSCLDISDETEFFTVVVGTVLVSFLLIRCSRCKVL